MSQFAVPLDVRNSFIDLAFVENNDRFTKPHCCCVDHRQASQLSKTWSTGTKSTTQGFCWSSRDSRLCREQRPSHKTPLAVVSFTDKHHLFRRRGPLEQRAPPTASVEPAATSRHPTAPLVSVSVSVKVAGRLAEAQAPTSS